MSEGSVALLSRHDASQATRLESFVSVGLSPTGCFALNWTRRDSSTDPPGSRSSERSRSRGVMLARGREVDVPENDREAFVRRLRAAFSASPQVDEKLRRPTPAIKHTGSRVFQSGVI